MTPDLTTAPLSVADLELSDTVVRRIEAWRKAINAGEADQIRLTGMRLSNALDEFGSAVDRSHFAAFIAECAVADHAPVQPFTDGMG